MNVTTALLAIALAAPFVLRPVTASAADLASAKELYASASYEQALAVLSQIEDAEHNEQVDQYLALCLLALDRATEAEHAVEALVASHPLYVVSGDEVSPRFVDL